MRTQKRASTPSKYRLWYNEWVEKNAKGRVLDIGVSKYWDYGFETMDNDPEKEPTYLQDICQSTLGSGQYDMILCNGVYEAVSDPQKMIDEVRRMLKPGGVALFGFMGEDFKKYNVFKKGWRTFDGNRQVFDNFKVLEEKDFNKEYHFTVCQSS